MLRTHRIPGIKNKSLTKIVLRYFKFLVIFAKKILRFYSFPILWDGSRNSCYICICIRPNTEKEKPLNIYIPRLFVKVRYSRYSGCAPMFRKCRLHSNGHSKSSYDVTNYWRDFLPFYSWQAEKYSLIYIFTNIQTKWKRLYTLDDIFCK